MPPEHEPGQESPGQPDSRPDDPTEPLSPDGTADPDAPTEEMPSGTDPTAPDAPGGVPQIETRIQIADVSQAVHANAGDRAERALTDAAAERRGIKWLIGKIWHENLARPYYLLKETKKAQQEILESDNAYVHDSDDSSHWESAKKATVDRFLDDHLHSQEAKETLGESPEADVVKASVTSLIERFATGELSEEQFKEERARVLTTVSNHFPELGSQGLMYADNLLDIAKQVRQALDTGATLDQLDLDFEVSFGRARTGVRSEAMLGRIEDKLDRLQRGFKGRNALLVNEGTMALVISAVGASAARGLGSKSLGWASFGLTLGAAGAMAGGREGLRTEQEMAQHAREMAQGGEIEDGSKRRIELEKYRYETKSATELIDGLESILYEPDVDGQPWPKELSEEDFDLATKQMGEIDARIRLSDEKSLDLISYSDRVMVEIERRDLDVAMARAEALLDQYLSVHPEANPQQMTAAEHIEILSRAHIEDLHELEGGIYDRSEAFEKMKRRRIATAVVAGITVGAVVGVGAQEAMAEIMPSRVSVLEGASDSDQGGSLTVLEKLRSLVAGDAPTSELGQQVPTHEVKMGGTSFEVPTSVETVQNADGSFDLVHQKPGDGGQETLAAGLRFDEQGNPTPATARLMEERGIGSERTVTPVTDSERVRVSDDRYMANHAEGTTRVERVLWFDNDTQGVFDKNELGLWWGGDNGFDKNGNYTFNVSSMTPEGSYHDGLSADAQQLAREGKLKMLFSLSEGTQDRVFEVPIDEHGNAVIDKDSELAKAMFREQDGQAVFTGRYAEVATVVGHENGADQVRLLATHEGDGRGALYDTVQTTRQEVGVQLTPTEALAEKPTDVPPFIPFVPRRPLEPLAGQAGPGRGRAGAPGYRTPYRDGEAYREAEAEVELPVPTPSPRLVENPDADLRAPEELDWYFQQQAAERGSDYVEELDRNVDGSPTLSKLPEDTRLLVSIPVAAAHEADNIYETLSLYAAQDREALAQTMIVMNVNHIDDADPAAVARTMEEIKRAERDFPQLNLGYYTKEYERSWVEERDHGPYKGIFGEVVKGLYDTAMRAMQRGLESGQVKSADALVITNDADARGMSPHYLRDFIRGAEQNPDADTLSGFMRWGTAKYREYPGYALVMSALEAMQTEFKRDPVQSVTSPGANTGIKVSTLAGIGGANGDMGDGADTNLSRRVKQWRRTGEARDTSSTGYRGYRTAYRGAEYRDRSDTAERLPADPNRRAGVAVPAIIDTDPARSLEKYVAGLAVVDTWDDFSEKGYKPRPVVKGKPENLRRDYGAICDRVEFQISNLVQWYGGPEFEKALEKLLPAQNGQPMWTAVRDGDRIDFKLTPAGRKWLRPRLSEGSQRMAEAYERRKAAMLRGDQPAFAWPKPEGTVAKSTPTAPPGGGGGTRRRSRKRGR